MTETRYVDEYGQQINWDTDLPGNRPKISIYREVRADDGTVSTLLWATRGSKVSYQAILEARGHSEPTPVGDGLKVVEFEMPVASTTAVIDHNLGYDPTSVMVIVDGAVCSEYSVTFPLPGQRVLVGFDSIVKALIRII